MGKDEETIGDSKGLSASMRNVISIRRVGLLLLLTGGLEHEFIFFRGVAKNHQPV
jgi:hypothetical protein